MFGQVIILHVLNLFYFTLEVIISILQIRDNMYKILNRRHGKQQMVVAIIIFKNIDLCEKQIDGERDTHIHTDTIDI